MLDDVPSGHDVGLPRDYEARRPSRHDVSLHALRSCKRDEVGVDFKADHIVPSSLRGHAKGSGSGAHVNEPGAALRSGREQRELVSLGQHRNPKGLRVRELAVGARVVASEVVGDRGEKERYARHTTKV